MSCKRILSKKIYWVALGMVLVIGGYAYFGKGKTTGPETSKVERKTVTQMVSATGNVKPSQSVDLAFETSGRISSVNAEVGDVVGSGQILASLNSSELNTQLNKARADLSSQKAALDKANVDLENYYGDVINTVNSAYTNANDAVRIKVDALFSDDETNNPKLTFESTNSQGKTTSENQRFAAKGMLNNWLSQINAHGTDSSSAMLEKSLTDSKVNLNTVYSFLNTLMDTTINSASLSASTLITYKTSVNDARSEIDTAISTVTALIQKISAQKAAVASKEADIKSYEASIDTINEQISKTSLRSPIYGTVTKQDAKAGEIVSPNTIVTSIISSGSYEVDSYIPEVDIARVKIGNKADVTLDAYGNDVIFQATVTSIDPGETVIEGVSTYLTKLHFLKPDSRIKPGMTANIDIISASHENALSLPQRTVQKKNNAEFVLVPDTSTKDGSSTKEQVVTTGLRGFDGYIEILSGLSEGQEVIMPKLGK